MYFIVSKTNQFFLDHFLVPATEIPETVQLVLSMEILTICIMPEGGSEQKVCFWGFLKTYREFWTLTRSTKEV